MNLILDNGNTGIKAAIYEKGVLLGKTRISSDDSTSLLTFLGDSQPEKAIISSVGPEPEEIISLLSSLKVRTHNLSYRSMFPFEIDYQTPESLGIDRLAAVAGAVMYHPGKNILVIDAGSAITLDIVSGNTFAGGSISPGLQMRFNALHHFTSRLPLITYTDTFKFPATSTADAIAGGVVMGIVFEINEYIRTFKKRYTNLVTIITGGDGEKISSLADHSIELRKDLVTDGLNFLLDLNLTNIT